MHAYLRAAASLALALFIGPSAALAQSGGGFDLTWSSVDGGGTTSTGGPFSVSGSAGQPDAGAQMTGGVFAVDGGFWPGAPAPTATSTPTPTITPAPNPCASTSRVSVQGVPNGDGRLRVTVAETGSGPTLQSISFALDAHAVGNGLIDAPTPVSPVLSAAPLPVSITFPAGTTSYTFYVRRATAGQATTVPLTVADSCGSWPSFVGGGPGAF